MQRDANAGSVMQLNKKNNLSAKINRSVSPSRSPKSTPSSPLAKSSTNPSSRVFEKEKAKSSPAESKIGYTHISIRPVVNPVHHEVKEIVGFNFLGKNILIDKVCVAGWLSNHYPLSQENTMSGVPKTFLNAEAAFQAYKFTRITGVVDEFTTLDAAQALERKGAYKADKTFGGCGNKWKAMLAVLKAKFRNPALRSALLATGSAFLLNHPSAAGSDKTWSDNYDGTGCNGLGLGLMIVRDSLRGSTCNTFIYFSSSSTLYNFPNNRLS